MLIQFKKEKLNKSRMMKFLVLFPSLLGFLDFSRVLMRVLGDSFFPTVLVRPYIDHTEHMALIDRSRWSAANDHTKPVLGISIMSGARAVQIRGTVSSKGVPVLVIEKKLWRDAFQQAYRFVERCSNVPGESASECACHQVSANVIRSQSTSILT
jgi:hypothetical protein